MMEQYHLDCKNLFISTVRRKKLVSQNNYSFWARSVINCVYQSASDADYGAVRGPMRCEKLVIPCSTRTTAVQQVLKASTWS